MARIIRQYRGCFDAQYARIKFILYIKFPITTMKASHKYRKLRTINSLETDCTLDDNLDRSIKIKVHSPTEKTGSGKLDLVPEEMTQMRDLVTSMEVRGKNLMDVPELSRKQPQISLLEASNTTDQVQGERIRISNKSMYPGSDCFGDSMNFREMIITNGSKNLASDGQLTGLGLTNNKIILQRSGKLNSKKQEEFFKMTFKSQQSEEDKVNNSLVELEVDSDDEVMKRPYEAQTEKVIPVRIEDLEGVKQTPPRVKLSSKYESLQSFKSERQLKENRSNSRLKLRDYIYMVEASSKANNNKRLSQKYVKMQHAKQTPTFSKEDSPVIQKKTYDRPDCITRKQCIKTKYNVSNRMMFDILKQEIFAEIDMAQSKINSVRQELQKVEPSSLEPSNEELMILYNLRREMKEQINKKLQSTLQSLRSQPQPRNPNPNNPSNPI